jgi:hypothetical protein
MTEEQFQALLIHLWIMLAILALYRWHPDRFRLEILMNAFVVSGLIKRSRRSNSSRLEAIGDNGRCQHVSENA